MRIQSPADIGLTIRQRRKELLLDQQTLADRVGVSRQWIVEIERGKLRAELGLVLRTLRELNIQLDANNITVRPRKPGRGRAAAPDLDSVIDRFRDKRDER